MKCPLDDDNNDQTFIYPTACILVIFALARDVTVTGFSRENVFEIPRTINISAGVVVIVCRERCCDPDWCIYLSD